MRDTIKTSNEKRGFKDTNNFNKREVSNQLTNKPTIDLRKVEKVGRINI